MEGNPLHLSVETLGKVARLLLRQWIRCSLLWRKLSGEFWHRERIEFEEVRLILYRW
jgi:CII-binding regulator of phage lambda lysogenization HflD